MNPHHLSTEMVLFYQQKSEKKGLKILKSGNKTEVKMGKGCCSSCKEEVDEFEEDEEEEEEPEIVED